MTQETEYTGSIDLALQYTEEHMNGATFGITPNNYGGTRFYKEWEPEFTYPFNDFQFTFTPMVTYNGGLYVLTDDATEGLTPSADPAWTLIASTGGGAMGTFQGFYNAATNTPTLVNGTGAVGDFYITSVPGNATPSGEYANINQIVAYNSELTWQVGGQVTNTNELIIALDYVPVTGGTVIPGQLLTTAIGILAGNNTTNADNIATNTTDIATNTTAIGVNADNIATNSSDIVANTTAIGVNADNIATNSSDIVANTTAIATKANRQPSVTGTPQVAVVGVSGEYTASGIAQTDVTTQGNAFNAASQLVQLSPTAALPAVASDDTLVANPVSSTQTTLAQALIDLADGGTGTGTVTNVSSANTDIAVVTGTTTPVLTINSTVDGAADKIVKLNPTGQLGAIDIGTNGVVDAGVGYTGELNTVLADMITAVPAAQVQSNWTEANDTLPSYIANKPANLLTAVTAGANVAVDNTAQTAPVVSAPAVNFKYSKFFYVDPIAGVDTVANNGSQNTPFKTVAYALTIAPSGSAIVLLGKTTEAALTITKPNTDIITFGERSALCGFTNKITINITSASSIRFTGISFDGGIETASTNIGGVYVYNGQIGAPGFLKQDAAYTEFNDVDAGNGLNIISAGTTVINGGKFVAPAIAGATTRVSIFGDCAVLGNLTISTGSFLAWLGGYQYALQTGFAVTAVAGSTVLIDGVQFVRPDLTLSPLSLLGFWSIQYAEFLRGTSVLTGTNLEAQDWFDNIGLLNVPLVTTATQGLVLNPDGTVAKQVLATGSVTNVSSANTDITVATGTTTPVLTLNTGLTTGQIPKLTATGLPAVASDDTLVANPVSATQTTLAQALSDLNSAGGDVFLPDTLVVDPTGNDTTGNGSLTKPYATITKALAVASATAPDVTSIALGIGLYTENLSLISDVPIYALGSPILNQQVLIDGQHTLGDSNAINSISLNGIVFSSTSAGAIFTASSSPSPAYLKISNCKVETTSSTSFLSWGATNSDSGAMISNTQINGAGPNIVTVGAAVGSLQFADCDLASDLATSSTLGGSVNLTVINSTVANTITCSSAASVIGYNTRFFSTTASAILTTTSTGDSKFMGCSMDTSAVSAVSGTGAFQADVLCTFANPATSYATTLNGGQGVIVSNGFSDLRVNNGQLAPTPTGGTIEYSANTFYLTNNTTRFKIPTGDETTGIIDTAQLPVASPVAQGTNFRNSRIAATTATTPLTAAQLPPYAMLFIVNTQPSAATVITLPGAYLFSYSGLNTLTLAAGGTAMLMYSSGNDVDVVIS